MTDFEIINSAPRTNRHGGMITIVCGICLWFAVIGLMHVLTKNHIHELGREQRQMEKEIAALQQEMRTHNLQIEEALSRKNLMEKLSQNRSKLRAIQPASIVRIAVNPSSPELPDRP